VDFFNLDLTIPDLEEQKAIGKILETSQKEIIILNEKLKEVSNQKKGLMQQLLTGKIRVKL